MYDFDRILNRSERTCLKRRDAPGAAVPLGVAGMDFQAPPAVQEALQAWVLQGDMGYALPDPDLKPAIVRIRRIRNPSHPKRPGWPEEKD
jgi:bifunctional pyridoxal-dependent enzyme with beta-cystathionase and maltose regulon repressor activities